MSDTFLADIEHSGILPEEKGQLAASGITTYSRLFEMLGKADTDIETKKLICTTIRLLEDGIDREQVTTALLPIVQDRSEDVVLRVEAIQTIHFADNEQAIQPLRSIIFDETENVRVRAETIEWAHRLVFEDDLHGILPLLFSTTSDIRFWAVYALVSWRYSDEDLSFALSVLDKIAAFDHTLPEYWGWHVSREALLPLELICFQPHRQTELDEDGEEGEFSWHTYLISPAAEYERFHNLYRKWQPDWRYTVEEQPTINMRIDLGWLRQKLQEKWPAISFDVPPTAPQTYTLRWLLKIDGYNLLGGLHRDGYGLVLTGNWRAVYPFGIWYSRLFPNENLYFYEWAEIGVVLESNMSIVQLKQAIDEQYKKSD